MSGIYQAARQRHAPNGADLSEIPMTEQGSIKRHSEQSENPIEEGEYDVQATINQRSDLFRHTDLVELKQALQHQAAPDTKAEEVTFLTEMAVTLCALSMPTFFVLEYLGELKEALDVKDLTFIVEPTGLWASHGSVTRYLPFSPAQHLRNLEDAEEVAQAIITGAWDLPTAKHQLRLVQHNTDTYPRWLIVCGYPVRSGVMAVFAFGGGWTSMGWAALLGLGCGIFSEYFCTKKHPHIKRSQSYVASFVVGFISSFLYQYGLERCCIASTLASLMYWFPGFSVTFGMCEMLNGQIVVGASRFAAGTMIGMMIGLGVLSGQAVVAIWFPTVKEWLDPAHCQGVIAQDFWFLFILFPPLFASMALHFRMHWRQLGPPFIGCAVIYFAQYSLINYAQVPSSFACGIATMLCVIAVGIMKHVYSHTSPTVVFLPAINLMVPGSFTVRFFRGNHRDNDDKNNPQLPPADGGVGNHNDSRSKDKGTLRYPDVRAVFSQPATQQQPPPPPTPTDRAPRLQYGRASSAPQGTDVPYQVLNIDQDTISSRRMAPLPRDLRPAYSQPPSPPSFSPTRGASPNPYHIPTNTTNIYSLPFDPHLLPASNTHSPTYAFYPGDPKFMSAPIEGEGPFTTLTPPPMATHSRSPAPISREPTLDSVNEYATSQAIPTYSPPGVKKHGFTKLRPPLRVQRAKEENTCVSHQKEDEGDEREREKEGHREGNMDTLSSFKEWLNSVNSVFTFDPSRRSSKSKEVEGDDGQSGTADPTATHEAPSITVCRASIIFSDSSGSLAQRTQSGGGEQRTRSPPFTRAQPQNSTLSESAKETGGSTQTTPPPVQEQTENLPVRKESTEDKEGGEGTPKKGLAARRSSRFTVSMVRQEEGTVSGRVSEAGAVQPVTTTQEAAHESEPLSVVSHQAIPPTDEQTHPLGTIQSAPLTSVSNPPTTQDPPPTMRSQRNSRNSFDTLKPPPKNLPRPPLTPTSPLTSPPIESTSWSQPPVGSFAHKRTLSSDHVPGLYHQADPVITSHTQDAAYWRETNQMSWTSGRNHVPRQADYALRNQWTVGANSANMRVGRSAGDMLSHSNPGSPRMNAQPSAGSRRPRKGPFLPI